MQMSHRWQRPKMSKVLLHRWIKLGLPLALYQFKNLEVWLRV